MKQSMTATCKKEIGIYKIGQKYQVWLDVLFTKKTEIKDDGTPDRWHAQDGTERGEKVLFGEKNRRCIYNVNPYAGDAGYAIFENEQQLNNYFDLVLLPM